MSTPTKPTIRPTSTISRDLGSQIADHVREDAIAELLAVKDELVRRGCSDIELQLWNGFMISREANSSRSYERGVIPVGGICARRGDWRRDRSDRMCARVLWWVEADLVGADWEQVEGE